MSQVRYRNLEERLLANSILDRDTECWVWIGKIHWKGYGELSVRVRGKRSPVNKKAHRVSYEWFVGLIPEGLTLDHTCENKCCINPGHLEPVGRVENTKLMWERKKKAQNS